MSKNGKSDTNILQEALKLKQTPVDSWNLSELLTLSTAVLQTGSQNWVSVARTVKQLINDDDRPSDWFSSKNCALQYNMLLEQVQPTARKKKKKVNEERDESSTPDRVESHEEAIVRHIKMKRIEELKLLIEHEQALVQGIEFDLDLLRGFNITDEDLSRIESKVARDEEEEKERELAREKWLKEREEKKLSIQNAIHGLIKNPVKIPIKRGNSIEQKSEVEAGSEANFVETANAKTEVEVKDKKENETDSSKKDGEDSEMDVLPSNKNDDDIKDMMKQNVLSSNKNDDAKDMIKLNVLSSNKNDANDDVIKDMMKQNLNPVVRIEKMKPPPRTSKWARKLRDSLKNKREETDITQGRVLRSREGKSENASTSAEQQLKESDKSFENPQEDLVSATPSSKSAEQRKGKNELLQTIQQDDEAKPALASQFEKIKESVKSTDEQLQENVDEKTEIELVAKGVVDLEQENQSVKNEIDQRPNIQTNLDEKQIVDASPTQLEKIEGSDANLSSPTAKDLYYEIQSKEGGTQSTENLKPFSSMQLESSNTNESVEAKDEELKETENVETTKGGKTEGIHAIEDQPVDTKASKNDSEEFNDAKDQLETCQISREIGTDASVIEETNLSQVSNSSPQEINFGDLVLPSTKSNVTDSPSESKSSSSCKKLPDANIENILDHNEEQTGEKTDLSNIVELSESSYEVPKSTEANIDSKKESEEVVDSSKAKEPEEDNLKFENENEMSNVESEDDKSTKPDDLFIDEVEVCKTPSTEIPSHRQNLITSEPDVNESQEIENKTDSMDCDDIQSDTAKDNSAVEEQNPSEAVLEHKVEDETELFPVEKEETSNNASDLKTCSSSTNADSALSSRKTRQTVVATDSKTEKNIGTETVHSDSGCEKPISEDDLLPEVKQPQKSEIDNHIDYHTLGSDHRSEKSTKEVKQLCKTFELNKSKAEQNIDCHSLGSDSGTEKSISEVDLHIEVKQPQKTRESLVSSKSELECRNLDSDSGTEKSTNVVELNIEVKQLRKTKLSLGSNKSETDQSVECHNVKSESETEKSANGDEILTKVKQSRKTRGSLAASKSENIVGSESQPEIEQLQKTISPGLQETDENIKRSTTDSKTENTTIQTELIIHPKVEQLRQKRHSNKPEAVKTSEQESVSSDSGSEKPLNDDDDDESLLLPKGKQLRKSRCSIAESKTSNEEKALHSNVVNSDSGTDRSTSDNERIVLHSDVKRLRITRRSIASAPTDSLNSDSDSMSDTNSKVNFRPRKTRQSSASDKSDTASTTVPISFDETTVSERGDEIRKLKRRPSAEELQLKDVKTLDSKSGPVFVTSCNQLELKDSAPSAMEIEVTKELAIEASTTDSSCPEARIDQTSFDTTGTIIKSADHTVNTFLSSGDTDTPTNDDITCTKKSFDKTGSSTSKAVDNTASSSKVVKDTASTSKANDDIAITSKPVDSNESSSKAIDCTDDTCNIGKAVNIASTSKAVDDIASTSKAVNIASTSKAVDDIASSSKAAADSPESSNCADDFTSLVLPTVKRESYRRTYSKKEVLTDDEETSTIHSVSVSNSNSEVESDGEASRTTRSGRKSDVGLVSESNLLEDDSELKKKWRRQATAVLNNSKFHKSVLKLLPNQKDGAINIKTLTSIKHDIELGKILNVDDLRWHVTHMLASISLHHRSNSKEFKSLVSLLGDFNNLVNVILMKVSNEPSKKVAQKRQASLPNIDLKSKKMKK